MRSRLCTIVTLLLFTVWQTVPALGNGAPSVLILGDSLSAAYGITEEESWVSLLRDRLKSQGYGYRVVNASIGGDTTSSGLSRLEQLLERKDPAIVLIELGGNDGLRGTRIEAIRANLAAMIEHSKAAGARVILAGMMMPPNYGPYADRFAAIYPELAEAYDVALIDFFLDGVALDMELMQADGIHPGVDAQPVLLDNVWPVLVRELEYLEATR